MVSNNISCGAPYIYLYALYRSLCLIFVYRYMSEHLLGELVCVYVCCAKHNLVCISYYIYKYIRVYDRSRAIDTWAQTSKSNAKLAASQTEHLV